MQKAYLLLRNNQQTGPYTFEEILQLNLKPFDLVWEEGRSAAWRYPGEVESLKDFVDATPKPVSPYEPVPTSYMDEKASQAGAQSNTMNPEPRKVFVSMPGQTGPASSSIPARSIQEEPTQPDPIISKAEEISKKVQAYADQSLVTQRQSTGYQPVYEEDPYPPRSEELYSYFKPAKKKNSFGKKDLAITIGIIAIIAMGYIVISQPSITNQAPSKNTMASVPVKPLPNQPLVTKDESNVVEEAVDRKLETKLSPREINEPVNKTKTTAHKTSDPIPAEPTIVANMPVEEEVINETVIVEDKIEQPTETSAEPKKEKRKLREVVKGIFGKSPGKNDKTDKGPILEEPQRADDRKAKKREETNFPVTGEDLASISRNIDLSSNAPDNWMMGVKNLKVTLRNRNNVALQSATATVAYFDSNNQLLEKKSIQFINVPANGKATVQAPDHKWADHTEISLGDISIRKDIYARDR